MVAASGVPVSHDGGSKDQRRGAQRHGLLLSHRDEHLIGGTAAVGVEVAVQKHDDQARDGQQVQQPRLGRAGGVGPVQRQSERCTQRPDNTPHQRRQHQPLGAHRLIPRRAAQIPFDPLQGDPSYAMQNLRLL